MHTELLKEGDLTLMEFEAFIAPILPVDEVQGAFFHPVEVLSQAAFGNYRSLRAAYIKDNQTDAAWSCRNLLEIALFTKFVLASQPNAADFAADRLIDGYQMGNSLKNLALSMNASLAASSFDYVAQTFESQMKTEGIARRKPLSMEDLAKKVDMSDEYRNVNKLCSKFVHPTAWSLFTAEQGSERFLEASEIFYAKGTEYLATVFATVAPYIRKHGLSHAKQQKS